MKNALLLSLALIVVGPVAVEGQSEAGRKNLELVNLLLKSRTCEVVPTSDQRSSYESCTYRLDGLELNVATNGNFRVTELDGSLWNLAHPGPSNFIWITQRGDDGNPLAVATICVGDRNTGQLTNKIIICG